MSFLSLPSTFDQHFQLPGRARTAIRTAIRTLTHTFGTCFRTLQNPFQLLLFDRSAHVSCVCPYPSELAIRLCFNVATSVALLSAHIALASWSCRCVSHPLGEVVTSPPFVCTATKRENGAQLKFRRVQGKQNLMRAVQVHQE